MTKYLSYFCLIFLCACASTEKKAPEVKTYSDDTNRTFEMIERGGSYYLKKAPEQSVPTPQIKRPERRQPPPVSPSTTTRAYNSPESERPRAESDEKIIIDEKINFAETQIEAPRPAEKKPTPSNANSKADERLIEINQNLAFFCMKHRKNPAFGADEAKCMSFVNKTMSACQKVHKIVNSKLLNCIQTKLKNHKR